MPKLHPNAERLRADNRARADLIRGICAAHHDTPLTIENAYTLLDEGRHALRGWSPLMAARDVWPTAVLLFDLETLTALEARGEHDAVRILIAVSAAIAEWPRSRADAVRALAHAQALARIILQRRGLSSDEIEAAIDQALLMIPPRGPRHVRPPAPVSEVPRTLDAAVSALVQKVRGEAAHGPVRPRHVLFRKGEDGWRRLLLVAFGSPSDLDSDVTWASNRVARMLGAAAAASVREDEADGAVVEVERRGADAIELFVLGRGRTPIEKRLVTDTKFDILPGGEPGQGWGWQDHDSLLRESLR